MPFVLRAVEPVYLSRKSLRREDGTPLVTDRELEAVTNNTLCGVLRQLASLVLVANDIFEDLAGQLRDVGERSRKLRSRISQVEEKVSAYDPKKVAVRHEDGECDGENGGADGEGGSYNGENDKDGKDCGEYDEDDDEADENDNENDEYGQGDGDNGDENAESDICSFSQLRRHFVSARPPDVGVPAGAAKLFSAETRPLAVRRLYEAAAKTPVPALRQLDRYRRDGHRASRHFVCTPVLGADRRRRAGRAPDLDIETRKPAVLDELRRWTSQEAIGDVTVAPDCSARIAPSPEPGMDELDHRLPSPEEQVQTVALRFPSEVVLVDTSGRAFDRMSLLRRSLLQGEGDEEVRRRGGKARRPRSKRRNTIAGTDQKELVEAVVGDMTTEGEDMADAMRPLGSRPATRSASSDVLRPKEDSPTDGKKSHFNSLKQWGKGKLRLIRSSSTDKTSSLSAGHEEANIYEAVGAKGNRKLDLKHDRRLSKPSAGTSLPISSSSGPMSMAVKLRENSLLRRKKKECGEDAVHSSSGNWSASSESGRASVGSSENATVTSAHPRSTTATLSSAGTSSNSLSHGHNPPSSSSAGSRRKFATTSASSSFSEGTLTPDIAPSFPDDGETSSVYSCDTEGYYTSFHVDSGLKTLREEDPAGALQVPLQSTSALSGSPNRSSTLTAESEYELFGKGSTSTTTSSAGTVCTTLMFGNESGLSAPSAPAVPERKSSLEPVNSLERNIQKVTVMIHEHKDDAATSESPDSGHNTSSSPVGSTNSPQGTLTGRSSEYEFSESDLEGFDRIERIRVKTTINSSRIPSMCVITPPQSDDEASPSQYGPLYRLPPSDARSGTGGPEARHHHKLSPRRLEKQLSTDSDRSSENELTKVSPRVLAKRHSLSRLDKMPGSLSARNDDGGFPSRSPSGETVIFNGTTENSPPEPHSEDQHRPSLETMGKAKGALAGVGRKPQGPRSVGDASATMSEGNVSPADAGDYVTIVDVHGKKSQPHHQPSSNAPHYSNMVKKTVPATSTQLLTRETEYVSLNELPPSSVGAQNAATSPADSLERKRRQGARVMLDSEGKVVYSSDSLKRNKGGYSSFEPGPYVKEAITSPVASPMTTHRVPKSGIRPVTTAPQSAKSPPAAHGYPTSPQLGKVIIKAGGRTSPAARVTSPTTPVVAPSPAARPLSPRQSARGAYVNVQSPDDPHRRPCVTTEDEEGKSPSYPPHHGNFVQSQSQQRSVADAGYGARCSPYQQVPVPQGQTSQKDFWTLPSRRSPHKMPSPQPHGDCSPFVRDGNGRYNTIATAGVRTQRVNTPTQGWPAPALAARDTSRHVEPVPCQAPAQQLQQRVTFVPYPSRHAGNLNPVSIPKVPRHIPGVRTAANVSNQNPHHLSRGFNPYQLQERFYSSTPEKSEAVVRHLQQNMKPTEFNNTLSPIERISSKEDRTGAPTSTADRKVLFEVNQGRCNERNQSPGANSPLKSPLHGKTSMTAEEIFAAIHKSKKKLNMRPESGGRSASPSCSSTTSVSPGNSEPSLAGEPLPAREARAGQNRHSWSPNSDESRSVCGQLEQKSLSPLTSPGSRQSWAGDRLGARQHTSRNDFKRLLLQHGAGHGGSLRGRMSAVEQLKLSKQQGESAGAKGPRSPADKRGNGSKLLQSPRSLAAWRFASPRTDVLSSTILEDCAEEEDTSGSPKDNVQGPDKGKGGNVSARRLLHFSSEVGRDGSAPKPVLEQYSREPSVRRSPRNADLGVPQSKPRSFLQEPLSPSNVKENVDTNQQFLSPSTLALMKRAYTSPDSSYYQSLSKQGALKPSQSPRIDDLLAKQRSYPSYAYAPGSRSALVVLDTQVLPKTSLETAL